jgi:hypothetical protein
MTSNGTTEAEMFCFDSIAKTIIGKSCSSILASATNATTILPKNRRNSLFEIYVCCHLELKIILKPKQSTVD